MDRVEDADLSRNVDERVLKGRWQKPGDHTFFKDIASRDRTEVTSRFVQDENVLQFKSLSLSYSFPQKWIKKMYMEQVETNFPDGGSVPDFYGEAGERVGLSLCPDV